MAGTHPALFGVRPHDGVETYVVLALAGTLGYLAGSLIGWWIGARGGGPLLERHGRWLHLCPDRLARAERWFDRFGRWAVFLGRLTPLVRSFISIPAGALGSPLPTYVLLTLAAALLWCFAFAGAGWALGSSYGGVHHAFRYVDYAAIAIVVLVVAGLIARHLRGRARERV